ncbi:MAG: thioredoxin family protein [Anaerolineae bacterium]|nr:thioredoxin family protein [Anaerolineae bacterium]
MALLNDQIRDQVSEMLVDLPNVVRLVMFKKAEDCPYCSIIEELITEVASTSDRVTVEVYDIEHDKEQVAAYGIDKAPVIAIVGAKDYGLRFFGIPANYEFSTLLHGIQVAGAGEPAQLDAATKSFLAGLNKPVHYEVFVTPTCPYCPGAAVLAFDMAVHSDYVKADVVEAGEFPDLAGRYNVMGVPLNVLNHTQRVEGRAPAQMIVDAIKASL